VCAWLASNQRLGNQNAVTNNGNHPTKNEMDAPNPKLTVSPSSSSSPLQKRKAVVFKDNDKQQEDEEEVPKQPTLGGSSSCDDVIEHPFKSSSS